MQGFGHRRAAPLRALRAALLALIAVALPAALAAQEATSPEAAPADPQAERAQALIEVLRDDASREALIGELERLAAPPETVAPEAADAPPASFGRQIAESTQEAAQSIAAGAARLAEQLRAVPATFAALGEADYAQLWTALRELLLIIVSTLAVFLILRALARRIYLAMGRSAAESGLARTLLLIFGSTAIDAAVVALAWAAGYAIALLSLGEYGTVGIRQTLYLNAFLLVEMSKVVLRAVLSPSTGDLRLLDVADATARFLNRWINAVVSLLGYGQLLVVPIVNQQVSYAAGRSLSALIGLLAILIAAVIVVRKRRDVAAWLTSQGRSEQRGVLPFLARNWHWPALLYLAALGVIVAARPGGVLFPVLGASGQILVAALVGLGLAGWLKRTIARGVHLPEAVNMRLPLLERRLNAFVPRMLWALRLVIVLAVAVFAAHTIGLIDVRAWMVSQVGAEVTATIVSVLFILLFAFLVWLAMSSWVEYRLNPDYGNVASSREQTLLTLLRNAATIAILVITLMFALSEIGLDIAPLLASAGVLGLAIGFGAQKLVQDIITGIFIQFENAINVGDVITVGGTTGVVERLTIRSVSLRDLHGVFHIIPFSSVDMVSNYMREFAYSVCDMGIAYREDVDEARQAMHDAFDELKADGEHGTSIMGDLEWFGVTQFGDSAVVVRSRIKTLPGLQWRIGRAYNAILKRIFDERGIEIPFPHQTIYFGEDKRGKAPAVHVALEREAGEAGETAKPGAKGEAAE